MCRKPCSSFVIQYRYNKYLRGVPFGWAAFDILSTVVIYQISFASFKLSVAVRIVHAYNRKKLKIVHPACGLEVFDNEFTHHTCWPSPDTGACSEAGPRFRAGLLTFQAFLNLWWTQGSRQKEKQKQDLVYLLLDHGL